MNYAQVVLFSFSVFIAAIIALIRFNKIERAWYPFIFCLWIASANELLSFALTMSGHYTIINNNVYVLVEALLITWQFKRWELFGQHSKLFPVVLVLLSLAWLVENTFVSGIQKVAFYIPVCYSSIIVLMSINGASAVIVYDRGKLAQNPTFLICVGYIIFFTFKVLTEALWLSGIKLSKPFSIHVYVVFTWINLCVNIIFAIAVLCIPPKPRFLSFS